MRRPLAAGLLAYVIFSACVAAFVYRDALKTALQQDRTAGQVRLSEAISRLKGQLAVYRALANTTANDPRMKFILRSKDEPEVSPELSLLSLTYGAWEIDLVNRNGQVMATSSERHLGYRYDTQLVSAAANGSLGYAIEVEEGTRLVRFSRRLRSLRSGQTFRSGAVVVSADLAALEFEWPVTPEPLIFVDRKGRAISSNRPALLLAPKDESGRAKGTFSLSPQILQSAQMLRVSIPLLRMDGIILLDKGEAQTTARLRAGLAITLLLALGLVVAILVQQRRRLAVEARQAATMEEQVERRTKELRAAQTALVEASNLAALGRLSAGISHELNQPLAAILNFAKNGTRLLEKNRLGDARNNLDLISGQVERITRIISHLRAFAKQDEVETEPVDLVAVVQTALELVEEERTAAHVSLTADLPRQEILVRAGRVRMEQVILILLTNAIDAMRDLDHPVLRVELRETEHDALVHVTDTGPGIAEPDRIFEPFYSTKELGASKGLGMGLALAFGLVSSFGGQLTGTNITSGARFTVTLPLITQGKTQS
ncbi:MAG: ATP-binding protein [Pseudomonadota bacterium]